MKILSLFDGIACGRVAFERMGINVEEYYAYEIDKYAIQIAKKNHPDIKECGDVFNADYSNYKNIDWLIGGSPCTFWSIAQTTQKRETKPEGFGWNLFSQYLRAIKEAKPKYFLYENNKSMSKDIKNCITENFGFEPILINSALVSAQSRQRLYWVGERQQDGTYKQVKVAQPKDKKIILKDILESGITYQDKNYCLTARYDGAVFWNTVQRKQKTMVLEPVRIGQIGKGGQGSRIYSVKGKSITLSASSGGHGAATGLYKIDVPDGEYVVRKLTPVEAERLQTLPDDYTKGVSNTQRYKGIGNGWTVDVICHLISETLKNNA